MVDGLTTDIRKVEEENIRLAEEKRDSVEVRERSSRVYRMGGCTVGGEEERGMERAEREDGEARKDNIAEALRALAEGEGGGGQGEDPDLLMPVKEDDRTLLSIRTENISTTSLVNLIDSHINAFKAKPENAEQSSL